MCLRGDNWPKRRDVGTGAARGHTIPAEVAGSEPLAAWLRSGAANVASGRVLASRHGFVAPSSPTITWQTRLGPSAKTASQRSILSGLVAVSVVDPDDHRIRGLDRGKRFLKCLFHIATPTGSKNLKSQAGSPGLLDRLEHPWWITFEEYLAHRQRDMPEQLLQSRLVTMPLVNARLEVVQIPALRFDGIIDHRRACGWTRRQATLASRILQAIPYQSSLPCLNSGRWLPVIAMAISHQSWQTDECPHAEPEPKRTIFPPDFR